MMEIKLKGPGKGYNGEFQGKSAKVPWFTGKLIIPFSFFSAPSKMQKCLQEHEHGGAKMSYPAGGEKGHIGFGQVGRVHNKRGRMKIIAHMVQRHDYHYKPP